MSDWRTHVSKSDWYKTRRNETDTDLFYKEGWKVNIAHVETLKQWLEVNIPFPVTVMREEKYRTNAFRNPIIISSDDKHNLEEFLPLIKENFGTNNVNIISEGVYSFKILIRRVLLISSQSEVDRTILKDLICKNIHCSFKSLEEFNKTANIVSVFFHFGSIYFLISNKVFFFCTSASI